ncbi:Malonyl CoA-acyl carrier protein transacylase [Pseudoruegeria aquimaris]|uniref:[acyl-carrier-protein] S-malonyltransferase n=1 Tax=Pseudoruegeria aquimaris TaxID=393663 RepID=A0A1Y5RCM7_9RHOB|nr:acyl carrier protein [Pseudoruegeria aquimaris]SLN11799.1 Malonyl CoA-acyl carrier protein transacylase [Pseudoruegeria aquimaris]
MRTAVVIAPGRGTYNRPEHGYLARHHADKAAIIAGFDAQRRAAGLPTLTELDSGTRFSAALHTRGDHASALIHACAYLDFLDIDRSRTEILAVTGNSMGWYIALTCAGALPAAEGFRLADTMGRLMQHHMIGGQVITSVVDDDWQPIPGEKARLLGLIDGIDGRGGARLSLSIDLGGMLVVAGNAEGLARFESEAPPRQGKFPMRLPNHAAFHSPLQAPVAARGRAALADLPYRHPALPMIDGRGALWRAPCDLAALSRYTLGTQVLEPYDFSAALRVAAREIMPDCFILLGPGATLGGAIGQSLCAIDWRGIGGKAAFKQRQAKAPVLFCMDDPRDRARLTA